MRSEASLTAQAPALSGQLEGEGGLLPVTLAAASRASLFATFSPGQAPADQTVFSRLVVQLPRGAVELSRCRLHLESARLPDRGRLVFLDDVYDCRRLVSEGRLVNLKTTFQNVSLVLAQKDRIRPEFRDYTANLLYDLSSYKKLFNEQDRLFTHEPGHVAREAQEALVATEGRKFFKYFDARLEELGQLVRGYDKEDHERHGFYLRRLAWDFILCSEFLKRTNLKPRGYAGDAEMMVMLYRNAYEGTRVFEKLMHKHPLETPAAQAVRNRRQLVAQLLRGVRARFEPLPEEGLRFLSVAAGPAWELHDVFQPGEDASRVHGVLLDQDPHAISWARETVQAVESACGQKLRVTYLNDSVRTMLRRADAVQRQGPFHFIYSMGLFDYLTPPVARAVLKKLYGLLAPGGSLVVGNYHVGDPTRYYLAYWMDWVLYYRTESEFLELAEDLPGATPSLSFDPTRCQMFLQLDKQG